MKRAARAMALVPALTALAAALSAACSHHDDTPPLASRDALLDPQTCKQCHADHFNEWSGSMHAYASDDPIFLAMNKRGQRETGGKLGNFCVNCHAPMAVHEGATTDGTNLDQVPQKLKGVTCFFCHSVDSVTGTHNAALHLADDMVLRGGFTDPVANTVHRAEYSNLHDGQKLESSSMCGACHDIVAPPGAAIERTFQEWQASVFSHAPLGDTCRECHMHETPKVPIADAPGVFARNKHEHTFAAIDTALTDFPNADAQKAAIKTLLDPELQSALCVSTNGPPQIRVLLDNVAAGHGFPSGASQDRRLWVEVLATKNGQTLYQSGVVPDGTSVTKLNDPDLWLLRDCIFDASGAEVHMFWQAAANESNTLPGQATFDTTDPRYYQTHVVQNYPRATAALSAPPDKVTMRVRLVPVGLDVLEELVSSGDLDPSVVAKMVPLDVGGTVTWTADAAKATYSEDRTTFACVTTTSFNVAADKVPAVNHTRCKP